METVQYLPILPCSLQKNLLLLDTLSLAAREADILTWRCFLLEVDLGLGQVSL